MVKEYIGLRVKMVFDPPDNSNLSNAFKERIEELRFYMNIADDRNHNWTED